MPPLHSFPPIARPGSRVLILGTMPGVASLRARQYYAHPRNAFWRIVGELFRFDPSAPYPVRAARLAAAGVAVWDVLKSCAREGSLDSDIDPATIVPNDFVTFFARHPRVRAVGFNGGPAEALYRKHVRPALVDGPELSYLRLPSTSPANATVSYARKARAWHVLASLV